MVCVPAKASRRLRWGALSLIAVMATMAVMTDPADARQRRKRIVKKPPAQTQAIQASPRYAAIVLDAKSGKTLHEASADALRHPASLTKIMTLYMLFEQLEAGKLKLHSPMEVSAHAAAQPPTKIGVKPGQTLMVEDAIKSLVTKSANDAAAVIAEALAGSEEEFARQMTRKARALGMNRTVYRNASGLPDMAQVTTAREQAILGLAIQERFPRYYRYFSLTGFTYRGHAMRNHNKLLGRVQGVDGIKTGYTRASGFNLVSSVRRSDRHIIAVVLGGSSGAQRDTRMRTLIEGHVMLASTTASPNRAVAAAPVAAPAPAPEAPRATQLASAVSVPILPPAAAPAPRAPAAKASGHTLSIGSTEPIQPVPVKTLVVKLAPTKTAEKTTAKVAAKSAPVAAAPAPAQAERFAAQPAPVQTAALAPVAVPEPAPAKVQAAAVQPPAPPPGARPGILGVLPAAAAAAGKAIIPAASAAETKAPVAAPRSGWIIQIGAFEAEAEAKQRLNAAQTKAAILKKADPYTERTTKGEKTYFRARFAGFDRDQAEAACKQLKRSDIVCISLKI
jgi:D-alanyl-D-alanine carboxypeptidase